MNKLSTTYIRFKVLFFASIVAVIALSLASCEKKSGRYALALYRYCFDTMPTQPKRSAAALSGPNRTLF